MALRVLNALADCFGDLSGLTHADANAALLIADDDQSGETEDLTALNNLCNAVDGDELLFEFRNFRSEITPILLHLMPP